jgi:protein-S-isoprenylcysteine O-methyltransferase Ste14
MSGRKDLTGERRFSDGGQLLCAAVFGAVWALDNFLLEWTTFLNDVVPVWLRTAVGAVFLVLAAVLGWSGHKAVFGEVRDPPTVVRSGPFTYLRHPLYFAEVLVYLGFLCMGISVAAAVVWIAATAFLFGLCRYEERLLVERFGDDYRSYMREVPMWIPRIKRAAKT